MSPNRANVDALVAIFADLDGLDDYTPEALAVELAKRGCLVPRALTVEQMTGEPMWRHDTEDGTARLIAALERIARGDEGA